MALTCPACSKVKMTPLFDPEKKLEIDLCKNCNGLWFDDHELREFLKSDRFTRMFLPDLINVGNVVAETYSITVKARVCPRCRVRLEERVHNGIAFDICAQCNGIFLDDGEINQILRAYRQGRKSGDKAIEAEMNAGLKRETQDPFSILTPIASFFKDFFDPKKK
ncbi:MAG: zf-TFIIB domain-containing protein [Candidatus Xenobiia bacterium LiM19]